MKSVLFLTSKGKWPTEAFMKLVDEKLGKDTRIHCGEGLLHVQSFENLIRDLQKKNELIGILISAPEAVYILSKDIDITNAVKLARNTGYVYESALNLVRQLANEADKELKGKSPV